MIGEEAGIDRHSGSNDLESDINVTEKSGDLLLMLPLSIRMCLF